MKGMKKMSIIEATRSIASIYSDKYEKIIQKGKSVVNSIVIDEQFTSIKGFKEYMEEKRTESVTSAICMLVGELYFKRKSKDGYSFSNLESSFNQWKSGNSAVKRLVSSPYRTNHIVDIISAINEKFNLFSEPGGDFRSHVEKVSSFVMSMSGSKGALSSMIAFYPRSIRDIAFMYCTYIRGTNKDYIEIVQSLEAPLLEYGKKKRAERSYRESPPRRRSASLYGTTREVKEQVVVSIINVHKDERELVISKLQSYISEHPEQFSANRHYCTVSDMLKWLTGESLPAWSETRTPIKLDHDLVKLFTDDDRDYAEKDDMLMPLIFALYNAVVEENDIATKSVLDQFFDDMKYGDPINSVAMAITFMRLVTVVAIADYYITENKSCRPEDKAKADAIINVINNVLDLMGLVHLNRIVAGKKPKKADAKDSREIIANSVDAFDWCICEYIKINCNKEKVR